MAIYQNGKEVTPKFNGKNLSRVMYNGNKIWPIAPSGINPDNAEKGTYIMSDDGLLYTIDNYIDKGSDKAIAIIDDSYKFLIDCNTKVKKIWGVPGKDIPNLTNFVDDGSCNAPNDYNGKSNTKILINNQGTEYAAGICNTSLITINGLAKNGYLPSIGELSVAYKHKADIDKIKSKFGFPSLSTEWIWSSTESSYTLAFYIIWGTGDIYAGSKSNTSQYAIPFFEI